MSKQSEKAALTKVKIIGDILVEGNYLSDELRNNIVAALAEEKNKGKFFGQVIKESGISIPKEIFDQALIDQAKIKASYALDDANKIIKGDIVDFERLSPHWGNGGVVNKAIDHPKEVDAISAAGNIAQLIVLLVKNDKDLMNKAIDGIKAASELCESLDSKDSSIDKHNPNELLKKINETLLLVAKERNVEEKIVEEYKSYRNYEIYATIIAKLEIQCKAQEQQNTQEQEAKKSELSQAGKILAERKEKQSEGRKL